MERDNTILIDDGEFDCEITEIAASDNRVSEKTNSKPIMASRMEICDNELAELPPISSLGRIPKKLKAVEERPRIVFRNPQSREMPQQQRHPQSRGKPQQQQHHLHQEESNNNINRKCVTGNITAHSNVRKNSAALSLGVELFPR